MTTTKTAKMALKLTVIANHFIHGQFLEPLLATGSSNCKDLYGLLLFLGWYHSMTGAGSSLVGVFRSTIKNVLTLFSGMVCTSTF